MFRVEVGLYCVLVALASLLSSLTNQTPNLNDLSNLLNSTHPSLSNTFMEASNLLSQSGEFDIDNRAILFSAEIFHYMITDVVMQAKFIYIKQRNDY